MYNFDVKFDVKSSQKQIYLSLQAHFQNVRNIEKVNLTTLNYVRIYILPHFESRHSDQLNR